jgi:hypothetical protein
MRGSTIYTECHRPIWIDVAERLRRDHGCNPTYWVGTDGFEPLVRAHFPDAVFHARHAAIRGIPPEALASMPLRGIDEDVLEQFAEAQVTALHMMDRLDTGRAFSYHERVEYFLKQFRYWHAIFERFEPECVVFPVQPHMVYDYIVYELCKHYGVRTSMFQWTPLPNVVFPLYRFEDASPRVAAEYKRLLADPPPALSPRVSAYVARITGTYQAAMPKYVAKAMPTDVRRDMFRRAAMRGTAASAHEGSALEVPRSRHAASSGVAASRGSEERRRLPFRKRLARLRKAARERWKRLRRRTRRTIERSGAQMIKTASRSIRRASRAAELIAQQSRYSKIRRRVAIARTDIRRLWKRWVVAVARGVAEGGTVRPLKERGRTFEQSFTGRLGVARLLRTRVRGQAFKRQLRRHYERLAREVPLDMPYVFVALHYQPEQTTCPTGSVFVDQFVMVDLVAKSVPRDWLVYVKEHPYQFFEASIGERGRSVELYDELAALPNVRLVPFSQSPFDLIDHARAVATVSGTAGIEAVLRGRPCLVFGYAWYRGCDGVFYTPSLAACQDAIDAIASGVRVDTRNVELFMEAVEAAGSLVDLGFGTETEAVAPDVNADRVVAAIVGCWREPA